LNDIFDISFSAIKVSSADFIVTCEWSMIEEINKDFLAPFMLVIESPEQNRG
jgi:hypothetical protein